MPRIRSADEAEAGKSRKLRLFPTRMSPLFRLRKILARLLRQLGLAQRDILPIDLTFPFLILDVYSIGISRGIFMCNLFVEKTSKLFSNSYSSYSLGIPPYLCDMILIRRLSVHINVDAILITQALLLSASCAAPSFKMGRLVPVFFQRKANRAESMQS